MTWLLVIALVVAVLATAKGAVTTIGARRWNERMAKLSRGLEASSATLVKAPGNPITHYDVAELEGLPPPVHRYFLAVLKDGQPIVSAVTIEMTGTMNMSATAEQWKPFTSTQRVVTAAAGARSGFIWNARISMLPGIGVRVVDSYVAGKGLLQAAVLGLFTVADMEGEGEMARGELMRFFAETPWYPTALLPSQGVRWSAVNETSARATLADGPNALTLLFHFDAAGMIDSVRADARGGMVGKEMVMRPWECGLSDYQSHDGMLIPMAGNAAWAEAERPTKYFHGTVKTLRYEWAPALAHRERATLPSRPS